MGHSIMEPGPRSKGVEPVYDWIFFSFLPKTLRPRFISLTEKLPLARADLPPEERPLLMWGRKG